MLPKDRELNIKRSFYRFLYEHLSLDYFINYSEASGQTLEERQKNRVDGWWKWIDLHWIKIGDGIFSISLLQVNCNTVIEEDRYGASLDEMGDDLQDELNIDSFPLLDFSNDPENPIPTDNVLIPRFRGSRSMPNAAGDTVNVKAMDWNIYVYRESILP